MKTSKENIVLLGDAEDKMIPVAEIAQELDLNLKLYNRSSENLSVKNAEEIFVKNTARLDAGAVLVHLGANDFEMFKANSEEFDKAYIKFVSSLKNSNPKIRIGLVSIDAENNSPAVAEMNRHIKALADSENCTFIDINKAVKSNYSSTVQISNFMYSLGFDRPLNIKKPLFDIAKIIYSYASENVFAKGTNQFSA